MSLINEALKRADADKAGKIPTAANARDLLPAHDRRPAARRRWALRLLAGLMLAGASAWTIHTFVKIPPPGSVQAQGTHGTAVLTPPEATPAPAPAVAEMLPARPSDEATHIETPAEPVDSTARGRLVVVTPTPQPAEPADVAADEPASSDSTRLEAVSQPPPVSPEPFFRFQYAEFLQAKIKGQKIILVLGLEMIPQRIPAVFLGLFHQSGPDGIEIDVGQAVDQCFAVFHDHALEPISPEKAPTVVAFVVEP